MIDGAEFTMRYGDPVTDPRAAETFALLQYTHNLGLIKPLIDLDGSSCQFLQNSIFFPGTKVGDYGGGVK